MLNFNNLTIKSSKEVEILDINLNFNHHIKSIYRKVGQKLSAHLRITKQKKLYKSMMKSQFIYFPLVWMFRSKLSNNLMNKSHERSLRISYKDQKTGYHNLLEARNEVTIHQRNMQVLMTEIYKIVGGVAPPIMNSLFDFRSGE